MTLLNVGAGLVIVAVGVVLWHGGVISAFAAGVVAGIVVTVLALFVVGAVLSAYPYNEEQQGYDARRREAAKAMLQRICKARSERA